jgi:hypothetical protein
LKNNLHHKLSNGPLPLGQCVAKALWGDKWRSGDESQPTFYGEVQIHIHPVHKTIVKSFTLSLPNFFGIYTYLTHPPKWIRFSTNKDERKNLSICAFKILTGI